MSWESEAKSELDSVASRHTHLGNMTRRKCRTKIDWVIWNAMVLEGMGKKGLHSDEKTHR